MSRQAIRYPRDLQRRSGGMSALSFLSLLAVAAVVVGGIVLAPDIARYIRIRNM